MTTPDSDNANERADLVASVPRPPGVTFVNASAAKMRAFQREEILGRPMHTLVHHLYEDGSAYRLEQCPMEWAFNKGKDDQVVDEALWRTDGTSLDVMYTSVPIRKDTEIVGAVVVFRDVTERRLEQENA